MVVFDNSIFCLTLHPDAKPKSGVDRARDRVEYLVETLGAQKETVIIPAPVLSELLVFAGPDAPDYLIKIRESSMLRVEPFDERAAIELADMEITARSKGNKRGSATGSEWQKVKFDRQIVAIAKANGASAVYTDDPDVVAHCKDCGMPVFGSTDLPLPPSKQMTLGEDGNESEETNTNETN
jgi:predicted nucleic acid-binding protein